MKKDSEKKILDRLVKLEKAVFGIKKKAIQAAGGSTDAPGLDFSLNERAFVKRHAAGKAGPSKFTILLAFVAKGDESKSIPVNLIKGHWNRMSTKQLLGKFNRFYPNEAKTRGWVDSKGHGLYCLSKEWKDAI